MEKNITQQEILLIKGASYFQHEYCEKDQTDTNINLSPTEKLEEACWNGLLNQFLPGILEKSAGGKALLLRQVKHGKSFLEIELCETHTAMDFYYSIDPYAFLQAGFSN